MSTNLRATPGEEPRPDGTGRRIAIVASRFNDAIVGDLVTGATTTLTEHGVNPDDITVIWVPGALEVPQVVRRLDTTGRYDAIVALGCVIRGGTYHFEIVCDTSAQALMQLSLTAGAVITNGILTVDDERQALDRSTLEPRPGTINKGTEAAHAALATLHCLDTLER